MDVDADPRAAGHILAELGFVVGRSGDGIQGAAEVVPEMWLPGTAHLRTSILATWVDHVAGLVAIDVLAPRVPVTLELDVHVHEHTPSTGTVRVQARLIKAGRSVVVCAVDVSDEEGRPIALGTASFMAAPDPGLELPRHLRPVRSGPAVATAEVRVGLGRVEVRDAGDGDRPVVTATTRAVAGPPCASRCAGPTARPRACGLTIWTPWRGRT